MKLGSVSVSDKVFAAKANQALVHQVVTASLANSRNNSKSLKSRSDVRGGGKKPFRQKGTGRARAGTSSSPIWRGGGVTFASNKPNYKQKINRKMYQSALRSILSDLLKNKRLKVVSSIEISQAKTKQLLDYLKKQKIEQDLLIICGQDNLNLFLASRNLINVACIYASEINPLNLLAYKNVLIDEPSVEFINNYLAQDD